MIDIDINPIAFMIGPIEVRWYGIMVALGILAVVLWLFWQVKKGAKISADTVFAASIVGIPSGIVVSRLLHVIDKWSYYSQNPSQIIGGQGLTIYGAILGAALGIWIYSKITKFRFEYFADLIVPGLIIGQAIGRVGCLLNGCCYGDPTSLPWGIAYTNPNSLVSAGLLGVSVQPTQVYEIIFLLIVLAIMLPLRKRIKPEGSVFLVYLSIYSVWRIAEDFLRDGSPFLLGLHQAQIIGLVVLIICITMLILKRHQMKKQIAQAAVDQISPVV
jgi:phosphatidylglycerol---prolipoprotein diacylglyceryl transferase